SLGDGKKVVLISDPGVAAAGVTDGIRVALESNGWRVALFDDFDGQAAVHSIDRAAELIRIERPSAVVGLGGGSALDVAKLATVVAGGDQGAEHYALMANALPPRTPRMIMLPTTAGTGAEVTRTAVFSNTKDCNVWAWGDELASDLVILDPDLTLTLPGSLTAATALDAMVHAIEACTNNRSNPVVRSWGLHAIRLIVENLAQAIENPQNLDARTNLIIAATLGGLAIDAVGTGIAHGIGHALGTIGRIHHGRAVALALEAVYLENAAAAVGIHARIAQAFGLQYDNDPPEALAIKGALFFSDFISRTGIEISLRHDGLGLADVDRLVAVVLSKENKPICENNCYTPDEADIRKFVLRLLKR
ncbi:MAG: iron-containing alcohol dehydrogenase, partial [Desulfobacterales bacterium]